VAGPCGHNDETFGTTKGAKYPDQANNCDIRKGSSPWSCCKWFLATLSYKRQTSQEVLVHYSFMLSVFVFSEYHTSRTRH
jgi:hypothetical protein